jgi:hypothetical protein
MAIINLKNFTILKKETRTGNKYYLIRDNESDSVYFCFYGTVKDG